MGKLICQVRNSTIPSSGLWPYISIIECSMAMHVGLEKPHADKTTLNAELPSPHTNPSVSQPQFGLATNLVRKWMSFHKLVHMWTSRSHDSCEPCMCDSYRSPRRITHLTLAARDLHGEPSKGWPSVKPMPISFIDLREAKRNRDSNAARKVNIAR